MKIATPPAVHMLLPGRELARLMPRRRETIAALVKRSGWSFAAYPTICTVNGEPVMRANWSRRLRAADQVVFISRPRGGATGTKGLVSMLGVIAIAALAPGIGTAVAGALFGGSVAAAQVAGAVVALGGIYAVKSLTASRPGGQGGEQEPLYTLNGGTNTARLLQTIPVQYGRIKKIPDFATAPWSEFEGDQQYLNVLLVNGSGRYQRDQILIEDTVLWDRVTGLNPSFTGVTWQFCDPGQAVTLFPVNVVTAAEVNGQEPTGPAVWVGGFTANAAGTLANALAFDFVMPGGLYRIDDDGDMRTRDVQIEVQYRRIDDAGAPLTGWVSAGMPLWTRRTKAQVRMSFKVDVPPGRYEGRVRRLNPVSTDGQVVDNILWQGFRAFMIGSNTFPDSVTALRIKATDQLSGDAAQKLGFVDTRILPVWNGSAWVEQPTRSPAWAALDLATNALYGGRRSLSKVDFQEFATLAALNDVRGDCFDYTFTASQPCLDALDMILASCRARTRWLGDVLSLFREQWRPLPEMMLTDQEVVRDSLSLKYDLLPNTAADGLILEYFDETIWRAAEVVAPRGATPSRPERRQLPGVTKRAQAQLEADFMWRSYLYRRVRVPLETEHDGRLLSIGSQITVQSEMPTAWGSGGEVVRRQGNGLFLSPPAAWGSGQHYMKVRRANGRPWGPVKVARGGNDGIAILDPVDLALVESQQGVTLDDALARPDGGPNASFDLGLGLAWQKRCLVVGGAPSGDQVALELWLDDPRVHDEDATAAPPLPSGPVLTNGAFPVIQGLVARVRTDEFPPTLDASWFPAPGAVSYVVQASYDEGESYVQLGEVRYPALTAKVEPLAMRVRVAGFNASGRQGPWTFVDLAEPEIRATNGNWSLESFEKGVRDYVGRVVGEVQARHEKLIADLDLLAAEQDSANWLDQKRIEREIAVNIGRTRALFSEQIAVLVSKDEALAQAITTLEAAVNGFEASLKVQWVASAGPAGALAAYSAVVKVSDALQTTQAAMRMVARSDGAGGAYAEIYLEGNRVMIGSSATGVFVPLAVFDAGMGQFVLNGDLIANGGITAIKISAGTLSAISANLGEIIAGLIRSANNKLRIDLNNARIEMWS